MKPLSGLCHFTGYKQTIETPRLTKSWIKYFVTDFKLQWSDMISINFAASSS